MPILRLKTAIWFSAFDCKYTEKCRYMKESVVKKIRIYKFKFYSFINDMKTEKRECINLGCDFGDGSK